VSSTVYYPAANDLAEVSTRPLGNFSRNSSQRANVTRMISLVNAYGHDSENPDEGYTVLFGIPV